MTVQELIEKLQSKNVNLGMKVYFQDNKREFHNFQVNGVATWGIGAFLMGNELKKSIFDDSETSRCRSNLAKYCMGDGLDLGYGGEAINETAICVDMPRKYCNYLDQPQHLHGDARNLHWFKDDVFDYVYSSHLLEDFDDTESVLKEWVRVVKPGGKIILFLPDEQTYRKHCEKTNQPPNCMHKHDDFSLEYMERIILKIGGLEIEYKKYPVAKYSFELVFRKKKKEKDGGVNREIHHLHASQVLE